MTIVYVFFLSNEKTTVYLHITQIKNDKISQQAENCENRNDPDLLQAFLCQQL
jgi:hypothetical protein